MVRHLFMKLHFSMFQSDMRFQVITLLVRGKLNTGQFTGLPLLVSGPFWVRSDLTCLEATATSWLWSTVMMLISWLRIITVCSRMNLVLHLDESIHRLSTRHHNICYFNLIHPTYHVGFLEQKNLKKSQKVDHGIELNISGSAYSLISVVLYSLSLSSVNGTRPSEKS